MTSKAALNLVKKSGLMLESGRGPVPNLAETIAGEAIRGSWWAHPKGRVIFRCSRAIRESKDVVVCHLVGGKVTYAHRRLWPALVRLASELGSHRLAAIREVHTATGKHRIEVVTFPKWVPPEVSRAAAKLTEEQAAKVLRKTGLGGSVLVGRGR